MPRGPSESKKLAAWWKSQIKLVEAEYKTYYERCDKILARYRDERKTIDDEKKNLNLFWSNIETLKPAIYSRTPQAIAERRFLDKDTTGRVAATILERAIRYEVSMSGFDRAMRRVRDDYLLPGRGQVWVRYNPTLGDSISPQSTAADEITDDGNEKPLETAREEEEDRDLRELLRESLDITYVNWKDYYQFPARVRTEEEIQGKGRRFYMTREDLIERFGKKKGKAVPLDYVPKALPDEGSKAESGQEPVQATIYEIWWKPTKRVYFLSKEGDDLLEEADDPLNLEHFFPCPPAILATTTNDTMIPVPDYAESQDQYVQIDNLAKRIDILTQALQVRGVYDASQQSLKRIFEEGKEPDLLPVDSWAMFAEKGGLKGAIDFVPLEMIASTLQILQESIDKQIEKLDRVTGIWDIMRGTSDARETLGGQRLKQNNGSQRLQDRQDEMARFCRDVISIMGEIISEHYDPKTLIQVSGALYDEGLDPPDIQPQVANQLPPPQGQQNISGTPQPPPNPGMAQPLGSPPTAAGQPMPQMGQLAPPSIVQGPEHPLAKMQRKTEMLADAIQLLRNDKLRGFRIDIETDSTIQGDAQEEKTKRIEFVEGVTKFVETAAKVTMGVPEFAPLAAKMLQFAVRGFRVGRDLESAIEDFCEKAEQDAKAAAANPQAKMDPKVQAEQVKAEVAKMQAAAEIKAQQVEAASEERNRVMEERIKMLDVQIAQIKAAADMKKVAMDDELAQREHERGKVEHTQQLELLKAKHTTNMAQAKEKPKNAER